MRKTMTWRPDNPVVTKELRSRMRGSRAYWLLFGYLVLLSLILFFSYLAWWNGSQGAMQTGSAAAGFTVGRLFFKILFYSQAVLIALITPALTAGAISIEREQRTFEMLRSTTLSPRSIVLGKLTSSVSFVILLLTSSLPLLSLCFLLGGVSPGEVFFAYLLLVGDAFLFGAIGLAWSAYAANTATATALSYATLILFFALTFPFAMPTFDENGYAPIFGLSALNPMGAVTGAVLPEHYYRWVWPAWIPALLLNGSLGMLLVLAAINRLEDFPARRAALLRGVTLGYCGLLVFFLNGMIIGLGGIANVGMVAPMQMLLVTSVGLIAALLFVPTLVTGDLAEWVTRGDWIRPLWSAWNPRRVFGQAILPSGLPLALLLALGLIALAFVGYHLGTPAGVGTGGAFRVAPPLSQLHDLLWQAALMLLAVVFGFAGVGFFLSTVLNNRWSALTLLYLAILLAMALPFFSYATLSAYDAHGAAQNPLINSLYLCPFIALYQLSSLLDPRVHDFNNNPVFTSLADYGSAPIWMTTGAVYFFLGLAGYAAAFLILRRRASRKAA